jgi:DNA adenine methylase
MKPLYMWAGGKSKMIPKYLLNPGIPLSGYDTYVEPFFGGGAMMIYIHENNPTVKRFVLNDINTEIVNLYRVIKSDVDRFIMFVNFLSDVYLPLDKEKRKEFFYETRERYITESVYQTWDRTQEAATLYFLMKTAFNGIFQSTKKAKGRFATPAGLLNQTTKIYDEGNVREWNIFLQKVDICSGNWKDCVHTDTKTFFFMDPPYRDSFAQYDQIFTEDNHKELINFCNDSGIQGHSVFLCNREMGDTFYLDNKGSLNISYYDVKYTAGRRSTDGDGAKQAKAAKEVLLYSM